MAIMTATGFVLFMCAIIAIQLKGKHSGLDWQDWVAIAALLAGTVLMLIGVGIWLWRVMP